MKKIFLISCVAATVMGLYSCSEDSFDNGGVKTPVTEGSPINLAVSTEDTKLPASVAENANTRTIYGDLTEGKYPVYWVNGDQVSVFCPEAQGEVKSTSYTVAGAEGNSTTHALTGANVLKWGASNTHNFYTFYPSKYVSGCNDGIVTATLPREQHVTVSQTTENGANVYSGCNMDYALMAGHMQIDRTTVDETTALTLPFTPITTALDIVIKAPTDGTSLAISSITIANPGDVIDRTPLCGTFTYNINEPQDGNSLWTINTNPNPQYYVNIVLDNPVTLRSGSNDELKVTAFLLPEVCNKLRVMVNARESFTDGATHVLSKNVPLTADHFRKKTTVEMGALKNTTEFSYETWMANLADMTYVSQLSMPGTHDAGAYNTTGLLDVSQTQVLDIASQLNAGIRVLDFRPAYRNGAFDVAHGIVTLDGVTFDGILSNAVSWLANHPTEFIIVCLKNESTDYPWTNNFEAWQQNIRAKLTSVNKDYVIADFNPSMTLGEARGKLLFMSRDDYDGGWYGCKISGWPDNEADWNRTFYTSSYPNGIGTLYVSDLYGGSLGAPSRNNKQNAISNMLNRAKGNSDSSTWFQTWLNVRGEITSPGRETGVYNEYAANIINGFSNNGTYEKSGIVMLDWAGNSNYNGDLIIQAVIDNNFRVAPPRSIR